MMFAEGDKVIAFPHGEKHIGFILDGPHGDEAKYSVETDGAVHQMGYRVVPGDEEGKTGGSFRKPGEGS